MNKKSLGILAVLTCATGLTALGGQLAEFFDNFAGTQLDASRWRIMQHQWGVDNGGVVRDNVVVSNGFLHLIGHGDLYGGPVHGVNKKGQRVARVTRVGAGIETANCFASGKYEARMRLPREFGACSAMWTFHYEEAYAGSRLYARLARIGGMTTADLLKIGLGAEQAKSLVADVTSIKGSRPAYLEQFGDGTYRTTGFFRNHVMNAADLDVENDFGKKVDIFNALCNAASLQPQGSKEDGFYLVRNQEIDIETPTALKTAPGDVSYGHARFNTWVGENTGEYTDNFDALNHAMNDGQFHVYRFDWHTASPAGVSQRVEFYVDNICYQTNYTHIPTIGGRFTLGLWFPTWAGTPVFDTASLDVEWVRITPFNESGDEWIDETD